MENGKIVELSKDQLNRVLAFFPRVDAKISVLLGVDIAMLALLAGKAPLKDLRWNSLAGIASGLAVILIGLSLMFLYQASFPRLVGGRRSLLYFREIAARKESAFIDAFVAQTEDAYVKDLLSQIWRNSEILKQKYNYLKYAFLALLCALPPWLIALALLVSLNPDLSAQPLK